MIRPLSGPDIPRLAAALAGLPLMKRYRSDQASLEASLTRALARGDGLLVEENLNGLAWFLRSGTFAVGGYLRLLAVLSPGHGLGGQLLAAYELEVAAASRHAFLLVSDFNHAAQRFYLRHGYTQVGALPGLVVDDVTELVYWKPLKRNSDG